MNDENNPYTHISFMFVRKLKESSYVNSIDAVAVASQIQAMHVAELNNRPLPRYPQSLPELLNNTPQSQIFLMQVSINRCKN